MLKWLVSVLLLILSHQALTEDAGIFKPSFLDLADDLKEASTSGRTLVVAFEQDHCTYCAKMHRETYSDPRVQQLLKYHFDVIRIDIWGSRQLSTFNGKSLTESVYAKSQRIQFSPYLIFLDPKGNPILTLPGYHAADKFVRILEYIAGQHYKTTPLRRFLNNEKTAALPASEVWVTSDSSLNQMLIDAKRSGKGLALLFGRDECSDCAMFRRILIDPEVIAVMKKHFIMSRINVAGSRVIEDMQGVAVVEKTFTETLDVQHFPTVAFFTSDGKEMIRMESLMQPEHFKELIQYAASHNVANGQSFREWLRYDAHR